MGPLNLAGKDRVLDMAISLEKQVGLLYWAQTGYCTGRVGKIKSLVTNQDTEFKILTFWTHHKTVKLTISQMENVTKMQVSI